MLGKKQKITHLNTLILLLFLGREITKIQSFHNFCSPHYDLNHCCPSPHSCRCPVHYNPALTVLVLGGGLLHHIRPTTLDKPGDSWIPGKKDFSLDFPRFQLTRIFLLSVLKSLTHFFQALLLFRCGYPA